MVNFDVNDVIEKNKPNDVVLLLVDINILVKEYNERTFTRLKLRKNIQTYVRDGKQLVISICKHDHFGIFKIVPDDGIILFFDPIMNYFSREDIEEWYLAVHWLLPCDTRYKLVKDKRSPQCDTYSCGYWCCAYVLYENEIEKLSTDTVCERITKLINNV